MTDHFRIKPSEAPWNAAGKRASLIQENFSPCDLEPACL